MEAHTPPPLTPKQLAVLDYIKAFWAERSYSPSTRDIQQHFGFASQTAAVNYLMALERKRVIRRHPRIPRSIVVL